MAGYDDFGDGGHADGIGSEDAVHLVLRWGFVGGPLGGEVDALDGADALLAGYLARHVEEGVVVGLVHVGETGSGGEVGTVEGMFGHEVDVVGDEHEVANAECGVHAARGVANEEVLDAQFVHDANGEGHLLHVVAFVVVKASLHGHHVLAAQTAEEELAAVSLHGAHGKVGNVAIGHGVHYFYFVGQMSQSCA